MVLTDNNTANNLVENYRYVSHHYFQLNRNKTLYVKFDHVEDLTIFQDQTFLAQFLEKII